MATTGHESEAINVQGLKASLQKLKTNHIDGKAGKSTTLAGYGITDAYTKSETYTKTEVNGLVDTPHQEYVTVDAYANLPETGSKDTIYRVSNYNGSTNQVDASVYSEYAWNGTQYIFLCVKSQIGEVFDISVYNNNAKYADLAAALGTDGEHVPQSLRKGGMSVKFVRSSDNKYLQYRFMLSGSFTNAQFTNIDNWQGVDQFPKYNSRNLSESGGIYENYVRKNIGSNLLDPNDDEVLFGKYPRYDGIIVENSIYNTSGYIPVEVGESYAGNNNEGTFRFVCFYDSQKNFLSSLYINTSTYIFSIPEGVSFVRVVIRVSGWQYAQVSKSSSQVEFVPYSPIGGFQAVPFNKSVTDEKIKSDRLDLIEKELEYFQLRRSNNLFNKDTMVVSGKYINNVGGLSNSSGWACTDYIPVESGEKYYITAKTIARSNGISWFNSNKELISGGSSAIFNKVQTAPDNAAFVVFNIAQNNVFSTDIMMAKSQVALSYENYYIIPTGSVQYLDDFVNKEIETKFDGIVSFGKLVLNKQGGTFTFTSELFESNSIILKQVSGSRNGVLNFGQEIFGDINTENTDDAAPVHILNYTLGANHGSPCTSVVITNHGFNNTVIGTEWLHSNGKKYYPIQIVNANTLLFMSENDGSLSSPSFSYMPTGTVSYNNITYNISSVTSTQFFPVIKNYSLSIFVDKKDITNILRGIFTCSECSFIESYDIMNPASVLENLISRAGESSEPVYDGIIAGTVENVYTIDESLNVIIASNFIAKETIAFLNVMFAQAAKVDANAKYYIPNSLPFGSVDLRTPQIVSWPLSSSLYTNLAHTKVQNYPINRVIQSTTTTGFSLGFLPLGVGENLFEHTSSTFELRSDTGKVYPHGADNDVEGNTLNVGDGFSAVMYRCFFELPTNTNRQSLYHFYHKEEKYVFIDYKGSMLDHIEIDDITLNGKKITVIESQNTELVTDVFNNGFYVNATYVTEETCYMIVKIS